MADTDTLAPVDDNLSLVALTPSEMGPAQSALAEWCVRKQAALKVELADLEEHALIAAGNGWKLRGLNASIRRTQQRIVYYDKVRAAVEAGYLMVPNFPITVLAVRVQRSKQKQTTASYDRSSAFEAHAELLPAGAGRYVDDRVFTIDESYPQEDGKGGQRHVSHYVSSDYDAPDFPFTAVKPAVLTATQDAMARRIFDRIGMVENTSGKDPIMVGQLLDPRGGGRLATFFIAWWLDTSSL